MMLVGSEERSNRVCDETPEIKLHCLDLRGLIADPIAVSPKCGYQDFKNMYQDFSELKIISLGPIKLSYGAQLKISAHFSQSNELKFIRFEKQSLVGIASKRFETKSGFTMRPNEFRTFLKTIGEFKILMKSLKL